MKTSAKRKTLQRQQLDDRLKKTGGAQLVLTPSGGWIRAIRESLGMSAEQLGQRMGVTKSTVLSLEEREQKGTASLETIRRAAEALDCTLSYSLVPRRRLEEILEEQALKVARAQIARVQHSMELEAQRPESRATERQVAELAKEFVSRMATEVWDL